MRKYDLFGTTIGLKYENGSFNYKSDIGGLLFLASLALALGMVAFYGKKFVSRDVPIMSQEVSKTWNPPQIDMTSFSLAIMTQWGGRNEFHDDIFKIVVSYNQIDKKNNQTYTTILPTKECLEEKFITDQDQFAGLELSKARCLDLKNKILQGSNLNSNYNYLTIQFQICPDQLDCMETEAMQKFIGTQKPNAFIYMYDSIFQPNNQTKFISKFVNSYQVKLTFDDLKSSNIYLATNYLNVQSGFVFSSDYDNYKAVFFDSARDEVSVRYPTQNETLTINLMSSKSSTSINISYMQFSEFMANVGAVVGNFFLFSKMIVTFINNRLFESELINSLISIQSIRNKDAEIKFQETSKKLEVNYLMSQNINRTKSFKISKYELISGYFCFKKRGKFGLYQKIKNKIDQKINYSKIYKKLYEVDLIKYLIFDEKRLNLMKNINKPQIYFNHNLRLKYKNAFTSYFFQNSDLKEKSVSEKKSLKYQYKNEIEHNILQIQNMKNKNLQIEIDNRLIETLNLS
jgi:hypothetical protein